MLNYYALLLCGVMAIVLGTFWYSPAGFGKRWMKELGITPAQVEEAKKKGMAGMWKAYLGQLVASLVTAFVLGSMIAYNGLTDIQTALVFVTFVWAGFFVAPSAGTVVWEKRSWTYWMINVGYSYVMLALSAVIFVSWK